MRGRAATVWCRWRKAPPWADGQRRNGRCCWTWRRAGSKRCRSPFAAARIREVAADLDETRFAWHGPTDGSGRVYYRIQGPRLLIEFSTLDDIGDAAGHYHSIYRNPANEYGGVAPRRE